MDPVAGIVTVSTQSLFIDASSVLGYDRVSSDPASLAETLPVEEWNDISYEETRNEFSYVQRLKLLQYTKAVAIQSPSNPASSWMALVSIGLRPIKDATTSPQTVSVDSSLTCKPTILECAWPTFVYFTAALGLDVISKGNVENLIKLKGQLEARANLPTPISFRALNRKKLFDIVPTARGNIGVLAPSTVALSIKRLMAWENIMLPDPQEPTLCIILPSREQFRLTDIVAFSSHGLVRWQPDANGEKKLTPLAREKYRLNDLSSRWRPDTFADAVTWAIYAEQVFAKHSIALPCSQVFLLFQERSLIWLGRMDTTERSKQLAALLGSDVVVKVEKYLRSEWDSHSFPREKLNNDRRDHFDLPLLADADCMRQLIQRVGKAGWTSAGMPMSISREEAPSRPQIEAAAPKILKHVESHEAYRNVLSKFNPIIVKRTDPDAALEPGSTMEFLAHLLLATSVIRATPRAQWFLHWEDIQDDGWMNCRRVPEYPLANILKNEKYPMDSIFFM
jgi:hypothetical protein